MYTLIASNNKIITYHSELPFVQCSCLYYANYSDSTIGLTQFPTVLAGLVALRCHVPGMYIKSL